MHHAAVLLVLVSYSASAWQPSHHVSKAVCRPSVSIISPVRRLHSPTAAATLGLDEDILKYDVKPIYPEVPSFRECVNFAVNAVGIYAAPTLMSLIDAAFIGRVSTTELAALGPAGSISDSIPFFLLFVSIAATNLVAKSSAANDTQGSARIARTAIAFSGLGGLTLAVATTLSAGALSRFYCGANVVLAPLCAQYVGIRALALPAVVVASVAQALCIGTKDTRTPMLAVAVAAALNFSGDLLLVNVLHLGLAGAAWATVLSQLCAAALLLRVLLRRGLLTSRTSRQRTHSEDAPMIGAAVVAASPTTHRATLVAICSFASFIFVMSVKVGVHNLCAATAASLGGAPAAAHTALMAVAWLCFTFGDVGSSLAQTYLPAFSTSPPASEDAAPPTMRFDVAAAWPTIAMLLRVTCSISLVVVALSSAIIGGGAGQLTPDLAVQQQIRQVCSAHLAPIALNGSPDVAGAQAQHPMTLLMWQVLPLMAATLATHGTAVTLEGLLLAQKAFRALALTYTFMGVSIAAALSLVRSSGAGLVGVWAVYVWYCFGRVIAFAGFGGLLRRRRHPTAAGRVVPTVPTVTT